MTKNDISAVQHTKYYACCAEPYPDVIFTLHLRRRSIFYVTKLIAPCLIIFLLSFLGFFLPVESGQKVNVEAAVLLALVVFLCMISETMPPAPDCIPVLGKYLFRVGFWTILLSWNVIYNAFLKIVNLKLFALEVRALSLVLRKAFCQFYVDNVTLEDGTVSFWLISSSPDTGI